MFMLRHEGRDEVEAMSYFSDYDNGKLYGPFPPGKYRANMLVSAGRSERADIPVTIENGKTKPLDFVFYGLPAGDYTLSIKAKGYRPFEKKYSVTPGVPGDFRASELIPVEKEE